MSETAANILIVDDEALNCQLMETLLQPQGYRTRSATSGEEALAAIAHEAPDLILLDIRMPDLDGRQIAIKLKTDPATHHIPIIMITAIVDSSTRLAALAAGVEELVVKPVEQVELLLRVRNLLRLKTLTDQVKNQKLVLEQTVQERTAELRESEQHTLRILETANDAFLAMDAEGRIIDWNARAERLFGWSRQEVMGRPLAETIIPPQYREAHEAGLKRFVATGEGPVLNKTIEITALHQKGYEIPVELSIWALITRQGQIFNAFIHDISERQEVAKKMHQLMNYDAVTGLPNRMLFNETLKQTLARALDSAWHVVIMLINVDHFKAINDSLGATVGDELLAQFSSRLIECAFLRDLVGRVGGDEFALIMMMQDGQEGAMLAVNRIRDALRPPFALTGHKVFVTVSIGITVYPDDAADFEALLNHAHTAMHQAKLAGRDTYRFSTTKMNSDVSTRRDLEVALRRAIENEEFLLHYQPKMDLKSGRIVGLEALLRWQRPGHGLIPPNDFIPVLEQTRLINPVGSWVIAAAARQIALWKRSSIGPVQISVNVSGRQFSEGDLVADVAKALSDNDIAADLLELELTESSLMADTEHTIASLQNLRNLGVKISIDDFGTGYSSLAYLRRFPVDKLKIDIAFVREITSNADDAAIALTIIRMAHGLKLDVIAEGVETAEQLDYLRRHECDQIQGYYFSRPLPVHELEQMLREEKCLPTANAARPN